MTQSTETDTLGRAGDIPPAPAAVIRRGDGRVGRLLLKIGQRLLAGAFVLWGAITVTFLGLQAMPGKIVDILAGDQSYPGLKKAITAQWDLNQPILLQYGHFLVRIVHGDFGTSYTLRQPVTQVVGSAVGPTILLALTALVIAVVLAVASAVLTAGRFPVLRSTLSGIEVVLTSMPVYWVGIVLLAIFSFGLGWFPVSGGTGIQALVLPAVTLALAPAAILSQVLRESLEVALQEPFIVTARARGISETLVRYRHALRHASVPVVNLSGSIVGGLLGGAVITETVFGRAGLGNVILTAVDGKDVPVVLVVVMIVAAIYVIVSTLVDIVTLFIDVRVRGDLGVA